jgi:hypothetical protein
VQRDRQDVYELDHVLQMVMVQLAFVCAPQVSSSVGAMRRHELKRIRIQAAPDKGPDTASTLQAADELDRAGERAEADTERGEGRDGLMSDPTRM